MLGAALLARKAVERGLTRKPWVKTTLAPGSKVVMDYYERAGLLPYMEKLGFNLVGFGCTTCIGNSGPLPDEISAAVNEADLAVVSVLSGNRNFEGRINPDVKMNYLASPPLVVAYALAGIDGHRHRPEQPLGDGRSDGNRVYLHDIWPAPAEIDETIARAINQEMFTATTPTCSPATSAGSRCRPRPARSSSGTPDSTYVRKPPYFDGMPATPAPVTDIAGARVLAQARRFGDHRPHLAGRRDQGRHPRRRSTWPSTGSPARTSTPTVPAAATTR